MTTAEQKSEHMGVIALREKVSQLKQQVTHLEHLQGADDEEARLVQEITRLQENLTALRRRRKVAVEKLDERRREVAHLEHTLDLCSTDSRVAQAVWLRLLVERQNERRR